MLSNKSKQPQRPSSQRYLIPVLVIVAVLLLIAILVGILLAGNLSRSKTGFLDENEFDIQELANYPTAYLQAGLPQYPGGDVTHFGAGTDSPKDGITLYVSTKDDISDIAKYYDMQLNELGWSLNNALSAQASGVITRTYQRGNQNFSLAITNDQQRNNIIITWEEK